MAARFLEALDNAINQAADSRLDGYQIQILNKIRQLDDKNEDLSKEINQARELILHAQMADTITEAILLRVQEMIVNGGGSGGSGDGLDLSNYATKTFVTNSIQSALTSVQADWSVGSPSNSAYIKNKPTALSAFTNDMGFLTEHQSLANYPTKDELEEALKNADVDLTGYATEEYVQNAVKNVSVDLTGYATEEKVSEMISSQGFLTAVPEEYVTETELLSRGFLTGIPEEYITETELLAMNFLTAEALVSYGFLTAIPEEYITEGELDVRGYLVAADLTGYATEQFVNEAIIKMASGGSIDLSTYATIEYVTQAIAGLNSGNIDLTGYATEEYVNAAVADKVTQPQVDTAINSALAVYKAALDLELESKYLKKSDYANVEFEIENINFETEFYSEGGNE